MKHTLVHNVDPDFLFTHQVVDDGLLMITSLVSIVSVESSGDVGVVVPLLPFLVSTTLAMTPCCLSNSVA